MRKFLLLWAIFFIPISWAWQIPAARFSTLNALLQITPLPELEDVRRPLTFFAPNDGAFQKLSVAQLIKLRQDLPLRMAFLRYHLLNAAVQPRAIFTGPVVTLSGELVYMIHDKQGISLNRTAQVIDRPQTMGHVVLYEITEVLQNPTFHWHSPPKSARISSKR